MSHSSNRKLSFLPFRPDVILPSNHTHQNVIIGGGMTTGCIVPEPSDYAPIVRLKPDYSPELSVPSWESSGVIIIDNNYHSRDGTVFQTIFLGLNAKSGRYELFYGKRDPGDHSPVDTAIREGGEETSNMFRFTTTDFDESFSVQTFDRRHKAYVIRVQSSCGIQSKVFNYNQTKLYAARAPGTWTELERITRISIKEAVSSGLLTNPDGAEFMLFDVYGFPAKICSRDAKFIKEALLAKMNICAPVHNLRFISSYDDKYCGNRNRFLNTTSYYMTTL